MADKRENGVVINDITGTRYKTEPNSNPNSKPKTVSLTTDAGTCEVTAQGQSILFETSGNVKITSPNETTYVAFKNENHSLVPNHAQNNQQFRALANQDGLANVFLTKMSDVIAVQMGKPTSAETETVNATFVASTLKKLGVKCTNAEGTDVPLPTLSEKNFRQIAEGLVGKERER